jgi:plasmid maintenance system killer protein
MRTIFKNEKVQAAYQDKGSKEWRAYSEQEKDALDALATTIEVAESLQDIRNIPPLHLEIIKGKLKNRRKPTGEWSVRAVGTKYRVIFIPCDDDGNEKIGGDILAEARTIKIIKITEVSKHYD